MLRNQYKKVIHLIFNKLRLTQNIGLYVIFILRFSELNGSTTEREAFNSENRGINYL